VAPSVSIHPEKPQAKFSKSSRLLKHAEFERVYSGGRRHFSSNLTVFFLARATQDQGPRVGFTVSRALGRAVERNRIRRRMREAARLNLKILDLPVDIVINPKKSALTADFGMLQSEVRRAFETIMRTATGAKA
jgi:ribonuclease P protein component